VALACILGINALFKKVKHEMISIESELRKLGTVFLEEYLGRQPAK